MPRNPAPSKQEKKPQPKPIEEQPPAGVAVVDVHEPVRPKKTPPRPEPKRPVSDILARRAEEAAVLVEAVEETLIALASDHTLTADDRSLLTSVGLVGERLEGELLRMKRIVSRQALAGTADDRERARENAKEAAAKVAKRGPVIDAAILALQTEKADLGATAESTRQTVESQEDAVKTLRTRNFLPDHIKAEFDSLRSQVQAFSPKLQGLKGEISHTEVLAQMEVTDKTVIEHAESKRLPCYKEVEHPHNPGRITYCVDPTGWQQYMDQRREDDEQRRVELAETEAEIEPFVEKQERLLGHYVL